MTKLDAVTVTLNPAIDETIFVDRLAPGAVHRALGFHRQPGGKGINVAAMLASAGLGVLATGLLGREGAGLFERFFEARAIRDGFVRVPGETRPGIKIVDRVPGETTDLNLPGRAPSAAELAELVAVLREHVTTGLWVVVSGSLPPGVEPAYLGELVRTIQSLGGRAAVDTSGEPLRVAIDAGADLVKPNRDELAELVGRDLKSFAEVLATAAELHERIPHVIVSLGHEGALFHMPELGVMAGAPTVEVVSTVGAGDALLAGYLAAHVAGKAPSERARDATVFAWCALESLERKLVEPAEREARAARIPVQPLPRS